MLCCFYIFIPSLQNAKMFLAAAKVICYKFGFGLFFTLFTYPRNLSLFIFTSCRSQVQILIEW
uniref:Uncharacterized protein n=1 Tax=Xenopus tropicalis TaxID=8364 RepID=A0A6I8SWJ7_XENTR